MVSELITDQKTLSYGLVGLDTVKERAILFVRTVNNHTLCRLSSLRWLQNLYRFSFVTLPTCDDEITIRGCTTSEKWDNVVGDPDTSNGSVTVIASPSLCDSVLMCSPISECDSFLLSLKSVSLNLERAWRDRTNGLLRDFDKFSPSFYIHYL